MKRQSSFRRIVSNGLIFLLVVGCTVPVTPTAIGGTAIPQATTATPTTAPPPTVAPKVPISTAAPLLTTAPTPTTTVQPAEFVWKITGEPNPLSKPIGVAVDTEGNVYVMDVGNSRVQKFDRNGKFLLMWGAKGNNDGQFNITMPDEGSVATDAEGNVYVGDANNYRIQKFDHNGKFLLKWGSQGEGDSQFTEIADIAFDKQNNVYVTDFQNNTVQKFDSSGRLLLRWGASGSSDGNFDGAGSVVIDSQGNVLVADIVNGRLEKFDSNGKFLSKYPLPPVANVSIVPYAIALDGQGNVYISDNPAHRIVKLDSNMNLLAVWGSEGEGAGQFIDMHTIRVDKEGNVYVTDAVNNCVQKFRQPSFRP